MKSSRIPLAVLLAVSGIALAGDSDTHQDQPAKFKITTKRKGDSVEVRADKARAVFGVKSPFGISQAVIERREATWPKAVVLRLRLKGLSNFRASNGKTTVNAAVSIQDGKLKVRFVEGRQGGRPPGQEEPALDGHPHRRRRRQAGQGASAEGRVLRGGAAEGVLRGQPEVGHAGLDRLLPARSRHRRRLTWAA
jgi:hypothetical protein